MMKPIVCINPAQCPDYAKNPVAIRDLIQQEGYIVLEVSSDDAVSMLDPNRYDGGVLAEDLSKAYPPKGPFS